MSLIYSNHFLRQLKRKIKKNPRLKEKVRHQVGLLMIDEKNPSLRLHRLKGKRASETSISIESNLRITFIKQGGNFILIDFISHDEY